MRKTSRCRMSESNELCAQMSHAPNTRRCQLSESITLLTHTDAARGQSPLEDASLERPRMQSFNRLLCQTALGEHTVYEIHGADTSICEHITRILATPLWELSFGGPKSDRMHRRVGKRRTQQGHVLPAHHFVVQK